MRAEMVNVVAAIEKSLGLLAKRLDYDTAPYRLEEYNAMIEDPSLWDDQDRAQKLMRDRQILVDAIATYEGIRQDLSDNLEMIELGAEEADEEVVNDAEERVGPIEILICNHGIGSAHERVIWEQENDTWSETMRINLDGPFYLSKRILRSMTERAYGRVVYTSSTAGIAAEHAGSAYNSSKHGLIGLMRSVAQDGGAFGVTSNAVLPGWVRTEMA